MAIAFFYTWTTYGTWLPGDERGWFKNGRLQNPDLTLKLESQLKMAESAFLLTHDQRRLVEFTTADHCVRRNWMLHAVNCRSNHVHVVATAHRRKIEDPRKQFKAWCTQKLDEHNDSMPFRENWWTQRGWDDYIDDINSLETIISYVRDVQDDPHH
jgi:REP element-mobilizing transposase RayT